MAQDIVNEAMNIINNTKEEQTTQNAATLGLGFHKFDGTTPVKEVLHQIGADFNVREDKLVRLPQALIEAVMRGEAVTIPTDYIIGSHKATVCSEQDKTIGVVGSDYGLIQNNTCFDMVDLMCNASVTDTPLRIVSAGLVHNFDPYIQAELPSVGRINGDNSDTKFYCFAHTSHDGTSGLQIRFSPVRVICANTYLANIKSMGHTYKHSKYVGERVDLSKEANIKRVQEWVAQLKIFTADYIEKMNSFAVARVTDEDINNYIANLFIDDEKIRKMARENNYNFGLIEDLSTRTKNVIDAFKDTMESGIGQDTNRGTKLWLFNATTNYLSNTASYGSKKDSELTRATKRFDSMLNGTANKRVEKAFELLAV